MQTTTVGNLLIDMVLPPDLRRPGRVLDKKGVQQLLQEVAEKHPDKYPQVLYDLTRIGHQVADDIGGYSFGVEHMRPTRTARETQTRLRATIRSIYADPAVSADEKRQKVIDLLASSGDTLQDKIYEEALADKNPLAMQVLSGAKGSKGNLRSLLGGDLMYVDHRDRPIPVPVLRSYSQGLSPAEYLVSTFGARKGVLATKTAVQDAGFLCLAEGTAVRMADGTDKPIEAVRVGEVVLGADRDGRVFPTPVTATFENGVRAVRRFSFKKLDSVVTVTATADHKVLAASPDGTAVTRLRNVDLYAGVVDGLTGDTLAFDSVVDVGDVPTYDLEVAHDAHLFVLANGLIVSNSKQLVQAAHRLVVTDVDGDGEPDTVRGLPVDAGDPDNVGALLAAPVAGYPRNTVLTPKILADIRAQTDGDILVRSPLVGGPANGGVYSRDVGVRERGSLAPRGDFVGIAASQAASEPLSQAQLSAKHSGGVAGAAKGVSGFKLIDKLVQVPKTFAGGATHAQLDGVVTQVRPAPQGGTYVTIGGKDHHVAVGLNPTVKVGDDLEAGDVLSEGVPNPAEIVAHKGIGEGRRYFTEAFRKAYADAGIGTHRRNVELIARGLIDHVRVTDETDDHLPDDVVPYSRLEASWKPREGYSLEPVKRAKGQYLEKPVLHYTIGTRVTPTVVKRLERHGVSNVAVHAAPPPFQPEMIRGMESVAHDTDWMTRFMSSYLQRSLLQGVHRGDEADEEGTSYVAALARGQDFGRIGATKGFEAKPVKPSGPRSLLDGLG